MLSPLQRYEIGTPFVATTSAQTILIVAYVNSFFIVNDCSNNILYTIYGSPDGIKEGDKDSVNNLYSAAEIAKHWVSLETGTITSNKSMNVAIYPYKYFRIDVNTSTGESSGRIWTNTITKIFGISSSPATPEPSTYITGAVVSYSNLPAASDHSTELWLVKTTTGILFARKEKGIYLSDGLNWTWMSDYQILYDDSSTTFYDDGDNTKRMQLQLSSISPSTTRVLAVQDRDGTIALNEDLTFETNVANIKMDGAISAGLLNIIARSDHIHPSDTAKVSIIFVNTTYTVKTSGGDFTTIQSALDSLKNTWINSDVAVTISVDAGTWVHTSPIVFRHPNGNRINIIGASQVSTAITSFQSSSGSAGNYSVTINVASTTNMAANDFVIIKSTTGTGEYPAVRGCWKILSIDSSTRLTVKNTYRKAAFPALTLTGGSVICEKTILQFNGCDGLWIDGSAGHFYNLAIVGNGAGSCDGVNISQRGTYLGSGTIYFGEGSQTYLVGINGFSRYGFANTSVADVWAMGLVISGSGSYGLYSYANARISGTNVISSGNGSIGVYAADFSSIILTYSYAVGNATVGFYAWNGGKIQAQYCESWGNIYSGFQASGGGYIDNRNGKSCNNGYHGYSIGSGSFLYGTSAVATGNGSVAGYYGFYASVGSNIRADSTTSSGNSSGDYRAENNSYIKVTSYVGSPTFFPALDTIGNGNSIIKATDANATNLSSDGNISHTGTKIGFFSTAAAVKTVVADQASWADVIAGSDTVTLTDLNTKMKAIRDKLQELTDALQSYGII